jgi:hypothetical protein
MATRVWAERLLLSGTVEQKPGLLPLALHGGVGNIWFLPRQCLLSISPSTRSYSTTSAHGARWCHRPSCQPARVEARLRYWHLAIRYPTQSDATLDGSCPDQHDGNLCGCQWAGGACPRRTILEDHTRAANRDACAVSPSTYHGVRIGVSKRGVWWRRIRSWLCENVITQTGRKGSVGAPADPSLRPFRFAAIATS